MFQSISYKKVGKLFLIILFLFIFFGIPAYNQKHRTNYSVEEAKESLGQ